MTSIGGHRTRSLWIAMLALLVPGLLLACGGGTSATTPPRSPSPTADAAVRDYLNLVNGFWSDHVSVTSGAVVVCLGTSPGSTNGVNPPLCKNHVVAMLAVQKKFLDSLGTITVPKQFATEDQTFRKQLPIANRDLEALISVCDTGNKLAVENATLTYISDMGPVLDALDQLSPGIQHV